MRDLEREKAFTDAISALNNARGTDQCKQMVVLCKLFIDETREYNDTAEGNSIYRHQGRIEAFKTMMEAITDGIPSR